MHLIANACEASEEGGLFLMWAGPSAGSVEVYVWASHLEDAFEDFVEWLDDHAPGHLIELGEDDLREAASDLGIPWQTDWPDHGDPDFAKVTEEAESGFTEIGHTTLENGNYIASYEWGGRDVMDAVEFEEVKRRSYQECWDHDFIKGDRVWFTDAGFDPDYGENEEEGTGVYEVESVNGDDISIYSVAKNLGFTVSPATLEHMEEGEERDDPGGGFIIRGAR